MRGAAATEDSSIGLECAVQGPVPCTVNTGWLSAIFVPSLILGLGEMAGEQIRMATGNDHKGLRRVLKRKTRLEKTNK